MTLMTLLFQRVRGWLRTLEHSGEIVTRRASANFWLPLPSIAIPLTSLAYWLLGGLLPQWPKSMASCRLMVVRP